MFRFFTILFLCLFLFPFTAYGSNQIKLVIDEQEITNLPEPPIILNDSVLVPAREAFENLNATVLWDGEHRQIYIFYQNQQLVMTLDQHTATLDGNQILMTVPPILHNDKTMIPLRFPAECFGFGVEWRGEERAAYLYSPVVYVEPEPDPPFEPQPEPQPPPNQEWHPETDVVSDHSAPPYDIILSPDEMARDRSTADIISMDYPETAIIALQTPEETHTAAYVIQASSAISSVEKFLLADNRLVIDIYNASYTITSPFYSDSIVPVNGIRASQFMDFPKVTRFVFDLRGPAEFAVSLSDDRKSITLSFERNTINEVRFTSTGVSDSVIITGTSQPLVNITQEYNPDRMMIRITNAIMNVSGEENTQGVFTSMVRIGQLGDNGYVEAHVSGNPAFHVEHGTNSVTVRFFKNNMTGMRYDYQQREIRISKESGLLIDINAITHFNENERNRYSLTLPVNAESTLGFGEISIRDGFVNSVSLEQDTFGHTRIVIHKARVLTFAVREEEDAYVIKVQSPLDLHPRIVIIDPGHGGSQPGSTSGGMLEKNINLNISLKLKQLLDQDPSITAFYTRLDDRDVSQAERAAFANANGDIFVSIHCNAMKGNSTPNGIETYFLAHENDAALGFSSERLAQIMQRQLIDGTGASNRGVKTDEPLIVLKETKIPAVLVELGFMTNPSEAAKLATEEYQWQLAQALYYGIIDAFNAYTPRR